MPISKQYLSASNNGQPISVTNITSPGTIIHSAHATAIDEVWLWAANTSAATVMLTIEFGGTGVSDQISVGIPSKAGLVLVAPGLPATNNTIRAFAASGINIIGYVNRLSA